MEATTAVERPYHAIAKLSPQGEPLLGDAQVILGDGTTKIMFHNGRAMVSAAEAEMLCKRGDVEIPGFVPGQDGPAEDVVVPPVGLVAQDGTIRIADLPPEIRRQLREELGIDPVVQEAVKPQTGDDEAIKAAQEYLAEEGENVPEPVAEPTVEKVVTVPEGFASTTSEGEPRCLARKGDGSQCANAAKGDTHACGLAKHQIQVAAY